MMKPFANIPTSSTGSGIYHWVRSVLERLRMRYRSQPLTGHHLGMENVLGKFMFMNLYLVGLTWIL